MNTTPPIHARPLIGLAKLKAEAAEKAKSALTVSGTTAKATLLDPKTVKERIGIVFDDSASMTGTKIKDAHAGIEDFLRNCRKDETSVAIYPMCSEALVLSLNLPALALLTKNINASGGTPLVGTATKLLNQEPLTRMIIFSDGEATDNQTFGYSEERTPVDKLIEEAIEKKLSIDTVFILSGTDYRTAKAIALMQKIAEGTGGVFLKFESGKSNFRTAFKYLSPTYRAMLADKSFVASIEEGKI